MEMYFKPNTGTLCKKNQRAQLLFILLLVANWNKTHFYIFLFGTELVSYSTEEVL